MEWASGGPEGFYQEPSFPAQMPFNYNQLEGRFKQLQGKMRSGCGNALFTGVATLSTVMMPSLQRGLCCTLPIILTEWGVWWNWEMQTGLVQRIFLHALHANILCLISLPQKSPGCRVNKRATRPEWVVIDNNGKPGKVGVVVLFC